MVVDDFNIKSIALFPTEAYSPLVVYSDAVLSFPVSTELFQLIAWRHPEIIQLLGTIQQE